MLERLPWLALIALLSLGACDSRSGPAPVAPPSAPASPAPAGAATTPATPPIRARPAEPSGRSSEQAASELGEAMDVLNRTMIAMREAGEGAAGASPCEHAYLSRMAADRARNQTLDQSPVTARAPRPRWIIAPREEFITHCETLPEALQRCAAFERLQQDRPACEEQLGALTAKRRRAWEALFHEQPPL